MSELNMMVTITSRKIGRKFADYYESAGLIVSTIALGEGTASDEVLDYFGLDNREKTVSIRLVTTEKWLEVKRDLRAKLKIDYPGTGIAFTVPLSSIGGGKALRYLTAGQTFEKGDETTLKDTKYELLVVIANQGHSELIMDAARKVHAAGGTVIHARGTGSQVAEKFMGVTLVPEKDMVFIVVPASRKNMIMQAIMDEAGTGTKAGAVVFSLPVTDIAGIRLSEDDD